jgi:hypothetical protein
LSLPSTFHRQKEVQGSDLLEKPSQLLGSQRVRRDQEDYLKHGGPSGNIISIHPPSINHLRRFGAIFFIFLFLLSSEPAARAQPRKLPASRPTRRDKTTRGERPRFILFWTALGGGGRGRTLLAPGSKIVWRMLVVVEVLARESEMRMVLWSEPGQVEE